MHDSFAPTFKTGAFVLRIYRSWEHIGRSAVVFCPAFTVRYWICDITSARCCNFLHAAMCSFPIDVLGTRQISLVSKQVCAVSFAIHAVLRKKLDEPSQCANKDFDYLMLNVHLHFKCSINYIDRFHVLHPEATSPFCW